MAASTSRAGSSSRNGWYLGHCSINDALAFDNVKKRVNIVGIVMERGAVHRCKNSTNYTRMFRIMDDSYTAYGITLAFFHPNVVNLQMGESNLNIIVLHDVMITSKPNGDLFFTCDHYKSSFALFGSFSEDGELVPKKKSAKYRRCDLDHQLVRKTRQWLWGESKFDAFYEKVRLLNDINREDSVDIVCKVLKLSKPTIVPQILYVWDGTDAPTVDNMPATSASHVFHHEDVPPFGTILMVVANKQFKQFDDLREHQFWVRICNIDFEWESGTWRGLLTENSIIRLLDPDDDIIKRHQRQQLY